MVTMVAITPSVGMSGTWTWGGDGWRPGPSPGWRGHLEILFPWKMGLGVNSLPLELVESPRALGAGVCVHRGLGDPLGLHRHLGRARYSVHNSEERKDVFLSSSECSFKVESLKRGTLSKVKPVAKTSVRASRVSEIMEAKTHGREPSFSKDQQGWSSGGCPITAIVLEYRPKGNWVWQSLRTNSSSEVFLRELREATWYELRMKACNSPRHCPPHRVHPRGGR
ncbi:PREDICTED: Down syndrome cell adhesion molecule-like protein 1 homolog [Calidris pugnax]|uniref:Down syndrome cell adhesion molecule-like protein 1 homolog n=1 Tax=Calidris pugnax TaxID=198806 RepID=UPI00071D884F|nr:PREDICTED: Down syndrome cell adhesion molecule-like protein 1 homolog [Calidris pugnax]